MRIWTFTRNENLVKRGMIVVIFMLFIGGSGSRIFAEGTKSISPTSTYCTALNVMPNQGTGSYFGCGADDRIHFYIKDYTQEKLYYGFQWRTYNPDRSDLLERVVMRIYNPDGSTYQDVNLSSGGAGFIENYNQAYNGPRITGTNTNYYNPLVFTPTANGEYTVMFKRQYSEQVWVGLPLIGHWETVWHDSPLDQWFISPYFDMTVAQNSTNIYDGRVYCNKWSLLAVDPTNYTNKVTASAEPVVYPYTPDGIVYKVDFEPGFQPIAFSLGMNSYGVKNGGDWVNDRKSATESSVDLTNCYKVFLNVPDNSIFSYATAPPAPVFVSPTVIGKFPGPYKIRFTLAEPGDIQFLVDLNGNNDYDPGTSDRLMELASCVTGLNTLVWDGKDGLGNVVPKGTSVILKASTRKGRTNLPLIDAEINKNGLKVSTVKPDATAATNIRIYWDDSALMPITTASDPALNNSTGAGLDNSLYGTNTPAHAWSGDGNLAKAIPAPAVGDNETDNKPQTDFGNARVINSWFWGIMMSANKTALLNTVSISGTVWNDANNSAAGTFSNISTSGEAGVNTGLYAILVDPITNTVIASTPVNSDGTYSLMDCPMNGTDMKVIISTTPGVEEAAPPATSIAAGWVNTSPLTRSVSTITSDLARVDFGVQQKPTAVGSTTSISPIPTGTNTTSVASLFGGTDPATGYLSSLKITAFPTNATSISINGVTYTSANFPAAGVTIPTNSAGVPTQPILVDPVGDVAVTVTLPFVVIDNGGAQSDNIANVVLSYVPQSEVSVSKVINNTAPLVGSNVIFTITATNNGPNGATNVSVTDNIPSGYTIVNVTPSAGTTWTSPTWTIGNLSSGSSAVLSIEAKVNVAGDYTNSASVTVSETDPATGNNSSTVTPNPVPVTDLKVAKTIDNTTPKVGSTVNFTITASNAGPSAATGVVVTDQLPTGYAFVSSSSTNYNSSTGAWTIGDLANGASASLTITATVNATGNYTNVATIKGNETDPNPTDPTGTVTPTPVPVADLKAAKTIDNTTPKVGSTVNFTITASNAGPSAATGVVVTDQLPTGYTFVSSGSTNYNSATGAWTIGDLANGASVTLTITATVNATGNYTNIATIKGNETDPNPTDPTGTITPTPVPVADLKVAKTIDNATPKVGSMVNFTITASNAGPSAATGVVVTDQLPTGYTFVSSSSANYNSATGAWTIGDLANGASVTLTITATVNATGNYTNIATIKGNETDPNPTDPTGTVTPTPVPVADLKVSKTIDNTTPKVGSTVNFTITASNAGPSAATGVVVTDQLPTGYTYVSSSSTNYNSSTGAWTIGDLANGASASLTITATVNATGNYTNVATIKGNEVDPNPTDPTGTVTPNPVPVADLKVAKTIDNTTPKVGGMVNFTITASNAGPSAATGVVVTDQLPTGYTFVSSSSTNYNSSTGAWTIGDLANGASASLTITVTVNAIGNYTNIATIKGNETDPNPTDPTGTVKPTIVPVADLSISKSVDKNQPLVGEQVTFTLIAKNNGPSDATGVKVNEVLPSGYTFVSANATMGTYNSATGIWAIGAFANGATAILTITAKVMP